MNVEQMATLKAVRPNELNANAANMPVSTHYVELAENPIVEVTALESFRAHLSHLEELHRRLSFMMGEVAELVRK